jgi:hypothetical protein
MPWIKVDDHFDEHPKLAKVGPLGIALWMAGLAYCNRNLTDGFIPWSIAGSLVSWDYLDISGPTRLYIGSHEAVYEENAVTSEYVIALLLDAGVWEEVPDGYRVHDFEDYQPSRAEVEADRDALRAARQAAGRCGGQASGRARRSKREANAKQNGSPVPVPVPVAFEKVSLRARENGDLEPIAAILPRAVKP